MAARAKVGYLIGQFPAINHFYLALEARALRRCGIEVLISSVSPSDRPIEELKPEEREELSNIYCLKSETVVQIAAAVGRAFLRAPLRFFQAWSLSASLARSHGKPFLHSAYYLAEAILAGQWMQRNSIRHLHTNFAANLGIIAARLFDIETSFTVHGFGELYDPVGNQLRRKIASASFVRSVSRHGIGQLMLACPPEDWVKLEYVRLGIDPAAFPPRPAREPSPSYELLSVGRLSPEKGYRILLDTVAALKQMQRHVTVRLAGDGPDREPLEKQAADLGIADRVIFEGWVGSPRLSALYEQADAFVLTSLYEGVPIVLMEAMAREVPCVAPAINGIPELIRHGIDGLLFNAADSSGLAEAVTRLMDDASFARRLGETARQRILSHWDIGVNTAKLAQLFFKTNACSS